MGQEVTVTKSTAAPRNTTLGIQQAGLANGKLCLYGMEPLRVFQSMLMATRPTYFSIRSVESSLKAPCKETSDFNESHCILEGPLEHISKCVDSVNPAAPFPYICVYSVDHFSVRDLFPEPVVIPSQKQVIVPLYKGTVTFPPDSFCITSK